MDERENLPAVIAAQAVAVQTEKRGSLVARGMIAILANNQQTLTKSNYALYRQAREVYNRLTDDGLGSWFGYKERELPLTEAFNSFQQLAAEGYGKAYFPLYTLYRGWQSIKADSAQSLHFLNLATDWLLDNQHLNDPEIWHDLGVIYLGEDNEQAIFWLHKSAEAGYSAAMWHLCGAYESEEDWDNALHCQIKAAKAGLKDAQHGLEQQHEHGDLETKIGDEQVFDWYVWSAEQGHLWAQLFLAYAFHCGDLIEQDDEQAAHWYLQAATQGEPHAQLQLGKIYWEGRGIEQDYDQAEHWLESSADQGSAESQYQFGQFLCEKGGEEEKAAQLIQCAADQEYGPAQYVIASDLGFFDVSEEQCAELFDKALTWYEVEAKFDSELRLDLALMHLNSWQAPYNKSHRANYFDGLRLLEEVASEPIAIDSDAEKPSVSNDAQRWASRRLGDEYLRGKVSEYTTGQGVYWLTRAVDFGDFFSCHTLGNLYLYGHAGSKHGRLPTQRIKPDKKVAVAWYERGSAMGDYHAARELGQLYLKGEYLRQDLPLAEKWLLYAANAGCIGAYSVLGSEYLSGERLRQDSKAAIHWMSLEALHSGRACLKLASIYLDGKIIPRNFDEAIKWLTLTSDVFRNDAMKFAQKKCADGLLSANEVATTQAWLAEMAAKANETFSDEKYPAREAFNAFNLGELYELGLGVERDMEAAVAWYTHAAELDSEKAQTRLDELGIDWEA